MSATASTAGRRSPDGSAGDADYGAIGVDYTAYRRPEPLIAKQIRVALGNAASVVNIGAGAGSYEPDDLPVVAVEPSAQMRAQRLDGGRSAVDAVADDLPFDDDAFGAVMATFTVHQWPDLQRGLAEMCRVARGAAVVLSCDPTLLERFWLVEYAPEVIVTVALRYPSMEAVGAGLTDADGYRTVEVAPIAIPLGCVDGFGEAYYGRPEALLNPDARRANSAWSFVGQDVHDRFERNLRADLADGTWDRRWGHLRRQPFFEGSLVLVVSRPAD